MSANFEEDRSMAMMDPLPVVALMTSDGPLESTVGEIRQVTISVTDHGRSIELSGVLYDGTRWDSSIPMPPHWRLMREAIGNVRNDGV